MVLSLGDGWIAWRTVETELRGGPPEEALQRRRSLGGGLKETQESRAVRELRGGNAARRREWC